MGLHQAPAGTAQRVLPRPVGKESVLPAGAPGLAEAPAIVRRGRGLGGPSARRRDGIRTRHRHAAPERRGQGTAPRPRSGPAADAPGVRSGDTPGPAGSLGAGPGQASPLGAGVGAATAPDTGPPCSLLPSPLQCSPILITKVTEPAAPSERTSPPPTPGGPASSASSRRGEPEQTAWGHGAGLSGPMASEQCCNRNSPTSRSPPSLLLPRPLPAPGS